MMWQAWGQLLRLPNLFSAWADIFLGFGLAQVICQRMLEQVQQSKHLEELAWEVPGFSSGVGLLCCSSCLYLAGMVLNDVFDVERDRQERPHRPLPSGQITVRTAQWVGFGLLFVGILFGGLVSVLLMTFAPLIIAITLAGLIVLYDGLLKQTVLAPFIMGGCRALNLLLGLSPALFLLEFSPDKPQSTMTLFLPLANGLYIAGVTWFARQEAKPESRQLLLLGVVLIVLGLVLHAFGFWIVQANDRVWVLSLSLVVWLGIRLWPALWQPTPLVVQRAVVACLLGLIYLDAIVATAWVDTTLGLVIICLTLPATALARWFAAT